ncbi:MAG: sigma 54-interacting transcriptional regulator, partial [Bdellovibrionia bacterium]
MDLTQFIYKEDEYCFTAKSESIATINNCLKNLRREALRGTAPEPHVLILGEIGVGKESLARMIHQGSRRSKNAWLVLNCALTKDEMTLEKEIFGEEKFAFNQKCILNGIFDLAQGGTVFLEKIEHLSPTLQNKLLTVLKDGKYRRVGGTEDLTFDIRLVSETDQNLKGTPSLPISKNTFSETLYQQLSGLTLEIPPLRNRPEDILPMANYFAELHFKNEGKQFPGFSPETEKTLSAYSWPGNTHELLYLIKRSALLSNSNTALILDPLNTSPLETLTTRNRDNPIENRSSEEGQTYTRLKKQWCNSFERSYLTKTLSRHKGNVSAAAREAKLDRSNFLRL